jgi:hypothetical protein
MRTACRVGVQDAAAPTRHTGGAICRDNRRCARDFLEPLNDLTVDDPGRISPSSM